MRNVLIALLVTTFLCACSKGNPPSTNKSDFKEQCIDGVTYIMFKENEPSKGYGYMSVKLNRDSKIVECEL